MVRRQTQKAKKKPVRASQVQRKIMDKKHFGDEPKFDTSKQLTQSELTQLLNWYSYMCDRSDSTEFRLEYLKDKDPKKYKVQKDMDEKLFSITSGWIYRLLSRGAVLPDSTVSFLERDFSSATQSMKIREAERDERSKKVNAPSVDRSRERADLVIGEIEEAIERMDPEFKTYEFLSGREVPSTWDKYFPRYEGLIAEYQAFLDGSDEQVVEAYAKAKKTVIRRKMKFLQEVVSDIDRYFGNKKAVRKPRARKEPSVDKKLKHIEFKREDKEYQLVSLDPRQMDGAKVLWIFNAKYANIAKVVPKDGGFDFKGKSILNFTGETRSIRRKTKEFLEEFLKAGNVTKRKMFEELKGKPGEFSGRINTEMVLLAVQR